LIAFITSILHPANCRSYEKVGRLLERTLRSVCRQSDGDFIVVVVSNCMPPAHFDDPRVLHVHVDFPPAHRPKGPPPDLEQRRLDKGTKYAAGLIYARAYHPTHVMFFDADDFIHRDIAAVVNGRPEADGWYIDQGYVYWEGSSRIFPIRKFWRFCGTCNIIAFRLLDPGDRLTPASSQTEILETLGDRLVRQVLGSHSFIAEQLHTLGWSLEPLGFPGAVYVRGTGENVSPHRGFPSLLGKRIGPKITEDFGLVPPASSWLRDLAGSFRQSFFRERMGRCVAAVFDKLRTKGLPARPNDR
jgi:hypothetical protein